MILILFNIFTDRSGQTVQTQIRLLLDSFFTVYNSLQSFGDLLLYGRMCLFQYLSDYNNVSVVLKFSPFTI